ncbi:MAG: hypothetical protein AAGB31_07655 [Bdellovibrio sp.]
MKTLLLISLLSFSCSSFAWTSKDSPSKDYAFKFKLQGQSLELREPAHSYDEAFDRAAQKCFKFFKGSGPVSENRGLDIIDVCANPRS